MRRILAAVLGMYTCASVSAAQDYRSAFAPSQLRDLPAGQPNAVLVLASPHLSQLPKTFRPEMVGPLIERFVAWKPTAVATEDSGGLLCDAMRRQGARQADAVKSYCYDPTAAGAATKLDVIAANAEVETTLAAWPAAPTAAQRRRLAVVLLAAGEPTSAVVQWLRLSAAERRADGALTPALAAALDKRMARTNESDLLAARVAAAAGLERVWAVDDQSFYAGEIDQAAFGAAMKAAWDSPALKDRMSAYERLDQGLGQPGGLMAMYRAMNAPEQAAVVYDSDFGAALREPSPGGYGRRYVAYWETRNLRMVANIREVLGRAPGTRLLAIVGASNKPYYEAYLAQMRDVRLNDAMPLLR